MGLCFVGDFPWCHSGFVRIPKPGGRGIYFGLRRWLLEVSVMTILFAGSCYDVLSRGSGPLAEIVISAPY